MPLRQASMDVFKPSMLQGDKLSPRDTEALPKVPQQSQPEIPNTVPVRFQPKGLPAALLPKNSQDPQMSQQQAVGQESLCLTFCSVTA